MLIIALTLTLPLKLKNNAETLKILNDKNQSKQNAGGSALNAV